MLVVIGIILILISVSFGAYVVMTRHGADQKTNVALETGKALFDNYRAADPKMVLLTQAQGTAQITLLPGPPTVNVTVNVPTMQLDYTATSGSPDYYDLDRNYYYLAACLGPRHEHQVETILANDNSTNKDTVRALDYTVQVMRVLMTVPENREIMSKLPDSAKYQLTELDHVGNAPANPQKIVPVDPPLLADGNGEPIYFIPSTGMVVAGNSGSVGSTASANSGVYPGTNPWPTVWMSDSRWHVAPPDGADNTPAPNPQSFWAAAGHDDDLGAPVPASTSVPKPSAWSPINVGSSNDNLYSIGK
jgi:hypothetical protein